MIPSSKGWLAPAIAEPVRVCYDARIYEAIEPDMTGLEFVSALIRSWVDLLSALAWPLAGVAIAFIFRRGIHGLLQGLTSLKMGPFDANFRQELDEAQAIATEISIEAKQGQQGEGPRTESFITLDELAVSAHPTGVIMEAWKVVESMLDAIAERHQLAATVHSRPVIGITGKSSSRPLPMPERALLRRELINSEEADLIRKMRTLRNHVAHSRRVSLTSDAVLEYVSLAQTAERFLAPLLRDRTGQQQD